MSDCADMTTALARELTAGIKNEVEDLSAVFKKMAILKPAVEQISLEDITDDVVVMEDIPVTPVYKIYPVRSVFIIDDTMNTEINITEAPVPPSGLLSFVNRAKANRKNAVVADDSLFDFFEAAA